MSSMTKRPTKRWAATAVAAGSISALVASPFAAGTASAHPSAKTVVERPLLTVTNIRSGVISLHAMTKPALEHATVYFYEVADGAKQVVGYNVTGNAGHAHVRVHMTPGTKHTFVAKAIGLNNPHRYKAPSPRHNFRSKYSNRVSHRVPR